MFRRVAVYAEKTNQGNYVTTHTVNINIICMCLLLISGHTRTALSQFLPIATATARSLETACVASRMSLLEVDPRPAASSWPQEGLCWVTPGFLNSCHTEPNVMGTLVSVAVGSQLWKTCMTFDGFDGRSQQFPVCTTGQAGGRGNVHVNGRALGCPEEPSIVPPAATSTPSKSSVGSDPLNQISCTAFDRFQNTLDNENHKCGFGDVLSWLCPFKLLIASDIHFKDRMSICCPAYPMKKDLSVIVSRQWASLPHHTPPPPPPTQGVPERWPHLRGALVSFLLLYFKHTQTLMMIKANAIT